MAAAASPQPSPHGASGIVCQALAVVPQSRQSVDVADVESEQRSFAWGVFVIADRDSTEWLPTSVGESGVAATGAGVAVRVRHGDDTESVSGARAQVTLNLFVGERRPSPQSVPAHEFEVPSGVVSIGDADAMREVAIRPGRWSVQVVLDDPDRAEVIDIWLTPAAST